MNDFVVSRRWKNSTTLAKCTGLANHDHYSFTYCSRGPIISQQIDMVKLGQFIYALLLLTLSLIIVVCRNTIATPPKIVDILFSSCYRSCDKRIMSRLQIIFAVTHFLLLQVSKVLKPSAFTRFVSSRLNIYQVSMTRFNAFNKKKPSYYEPFGLGSQWFSRFKSS